MTSQDLSKLHPQVKSFIDEVARADAPALNTLEIAAARDAYLAGVLRVRGSLIEMDSVTDQVMTGVGDGLPVRVYRPPGSGEAGAGAKALPTLIYFHGGGWCFGSIESHCHICRRLCAASGCLVVSLDYRLAPEHKFPAAVDDAIGCLEWVAGNGRDLGADPNRLAIGGDSAGATLATVAAIHASREGIPLGCQLLIYPATDMSMSLESHRKYGEGFRLTRPLMVWSTTNYLRDGQDILDPRASPLLVDGLSGVAPVLLITAGFDPLQDEGIAYGRKMREAGVEVERRGYEGMIHGFVSMPGLFDDAVKAMDDAGSYLAEKLQ